MKKWWLVFGSYFLVLLAWAVFSYSQTDPNLTLINQAWFIDFQNTIWLWGSDRTVLTWTYGIIIGLAFFTYGSIIYLLKKEKTSFDELLKKWGWLKLIGVYLAIIAPLLLAYNALSHDVFNYIFNARMVVNYGADPHVKVALDFAADDWTRFMHNTHTPAPYAYGFTLLSLVPYVLGLGKFISTWLMFRVMSLGGILLLVYSWLKYAKVAGFKLKLDQVALVLLNPLFVIEIVGNMHNDLWMMVPAILSLVYFAKKENQKKWLVLGWVLLGFSIYTKYATAVLIPLGMVVILVSMLDITLHKKLPAVAVAFLSKINIKSWVLKSIPLSASILMFVPLLLPRAQQFHPWYLVWVLVWLPLINLGDLSGLRLKLEQCLEKVPVFGAVTSFKRWWVITVLIFSVTSMFRYLPWLKYGGFSPEILLQQKMITWSAIPIGFLLWLITSKRKSSNWRRIN
jgi:hypothetical protein